MFKGKGILSGSLTSNSSQGAPMELSGAVKEGTKASKVKVRLSKAAIDKAVNKAVSKKAPKKEANNASRSTLSSLGIESSFEEAFDTEFDANDVWVEEMERYEGIPSHDRKSYDLFLSSFE